jgi:hypothetical protein
MIVAFRGYAKLSKNGGPQTAKIPDAGKGRPGKEKKWGGIEEGLSVQQQF